MTVVLDSKGDSIPARCETIERRNVLGIDVAVLDVGNALKLIRTSLDDAMPLRLAFLNAHGANIASSDDAYRATLDGFEVLADGIGVDLASRLLYGAPFPANLNGTDFLPHMLAELDGPLSIGLLGGGPGVAGRAAEMLAEIAPQHWYHTLGDGYFDAAGEDALLGRLDRSPVDILFVALGNPLQEKWIARKLQDHHATVAIGVGAFFDFMSGRVKRAPRAMIALRLEWLFRLSLEPKRLWRRYILGNPAFMARVLKQRFGKR